MQPVQLSPAPQSSDPKATLEAKKRKEAVRGFEEMFVAQMMKAMRQTVPEGEESRAKVLWREQFDAEIAKRIAEGRGIGLAPLLEKGIASTGGGNGRKR
ncbi:MAG: rod-binding protein [Candidatus Deferrimicrobiaceae bacterium]